MSSVERYSARFPAGSSPGRWRHPLGRSKVKISLFLHQKPPQSPGLPVRAGGRWAESAGGPGFRPGLGPPNISIPVLANCVRPQCQRLHIPTPQQEPLNVQEGTLQAAAPPRAPPAASALPYQTRAVRTQHRPTGPPRRPAKLNGLHLTSALPFSHAS